jgi:Tfp pilus assembly protein PilF
VEGKASQAIEECGTALRIDPTLAVAHNNLALTYAAVGRLDLAEGEFAKAGDTGNAAYNMGIVLMAQSRYSEAATQFESARFASPRPFDTDRRVHDALLLAEPGRTARGEQ